MTVMEPGSAATAETAGDESKLRPREAARLLGVHHNTIRNLARSGELPCAWTAYGRVFDPAEVLKLARRRERGGRPTVAGNAT